ncbi:hypothetical protein PGT21_008503 [Puccinia graminis f. sp. tritici]|uniref:Uncharacterized protein n=2 Tax=Puccinia graminis f. sp. tritici TaxID=56615 RepID=A0A5B0NUH6_PUCGR|nr:hypothetical protein PGT21_008503 [Puccinia graminis f. sp. tritici]
MSVYHGSMESEAAMADTADSDFDGLVGKQEERLGDLVVEGFKKLINTYDPDQDDLERPEPKPLPESSRLDAEKTKRGLLSWLELSLLPQLGQQITDLSALLDLTDLQKETDSTLRQILESQAELDQSLGKLQTSLYTLCPEPARSPPFESSDRNRKEFKSFRAHGLYHHITGQVLAEIIHVFNESYELIQQLELSTEPYKFPVEIDATRTAITHYAASTRDGIGSTIRWLKGSEFDLLRSHWLNEISGMNDTLSKLISLINSPPNTTGRPQLSLVPELDSFHYHPPSQPVIRLAKSVPPLLKLSRLFFKKMTRPEIDTKRLSSFTQSASHQLDHMAQSAGNIGCDFEELLKLFRKVDRRVDRLGRPIQEEEEPLVSSVQLTAITQRIGIRFQSYLFIILLYFHPVIPNNHSFDSQNHSKAWFLTWFNHFSIAVRNFEIAAEFFDDDA